MSTNKTPDLTFAELILGAEIDVDDLPKRRARVILRAHIKQGLDEADAGLFSDRTVADIAMAVLDEDEP
jgi:hypothetical protein